MSDNQGYVTNYDPNKIEEMWQQKTASDLGTAKTNLDAQMDELNSQRTNAAHDYRSLLNQASANYAMQQRAQRESMANMGLSAAGGTSRSFEQGARNNLSNQIGSIQRQERQYGEEVDRALRDLQNRYNAEVNSILANNNLQSTSQQIQSDQWLAGHNLEAYQWDEQFKWQQENAKVAQLIDLLRSKKISKKQFEALSGIKL